jgi:hypothetical protein
LFIANCILKIADRKLTATIDHSLPTPFILYFYNSISTVRSRIFSLLQTPFHQYLASYKSLYPTVIRSITPMFKRAIYCVYQNTHRNFVLKSIVWKSGTPFGMCITSIILHK